MVIYPGRDVDVDSLLGVKTLYFIVWMGEREENWLNKTDKLKSSSLISHFNLHVINFEYFSLC